MNPSHAGFDRTHEIDDALAALAAVQPRAGLEQRVLARIASEPALPWYHRFPFAPAAQHRWMLAAASVVIVAGGVGMSVYRNHAAGPAVAPVAIRMPRPAHQPAAAAAEIGVSRHPIPPEKVHTRHRGVQRSYRATHARTTLPRGTVAPLRPRALPNAQ